VGKKTNAVRILEKLQIPYELHEYSVDENHRSAVDAAIKLGISPKQLFKTLVVKGDRTGVMIACVPAPGELDLKALAALSGNKRAEMVPLAEVFPLTGYVKGGVSPIGCRLPYPVFIDETALTFPWISVSAGARGQQIFLSPTDLCRATAAVTGAIARMPHEGESVT